jgi:hypothetical protein
LSTLKIGWLCFCDSKSGLQGLPSALPWRRDSAELLHQPQNITYQLLALWRVADLGEQCFNLGLGRGRVE